MGLGGTGGLSICEVTVWPIASLLSHVHSQLAEIDGAILSSFIMDLIVRCLPFSRPGQSRQFLSGTSLNLDQ